MKRNDPTWFLQILWTTHKQEDTIQQKQFKLKCPATLWTSVSW